MREQTGAPLASVTALLAVQAVSSFIGTSVISALMDRFGRKNAMLVGLFALSLVLLLMSGATQLTQWALLIALYGVLQPVFFIGTNAMIADLVLPEQRTEAYAIARTVSNLSIALGPALAGTFIAQSQVFAYYATTAINLLLLIPVAWFLRETLVRAEKSDSAHSAAAHDDGGFRAILRDRPFVHFALVFGLLEVGVALVFNLLAVYVKENFSISEDQYGLLLAVNAGMVVFLQYAVTRVTRQYPPYLVLVAGALFYVAGLSGLALSLTMAHFVAAMVVLTLGELIVSPTGTALVANMAPPEKRARYMGVFALLYT